MKNKYKQFLITIFILFLLAFSLYLLPGKKTTLYFYNSDTKTPLEGEILFDNAYLGNLEKGNITFRNLKIIPDYLTYIGIENDEKFEIKYPFPEDYHSFEVLGFPLTNEEITFYKEYYQYHQKDLFPEIIEPHFMNKLITWKIEDKKQCWKTEEDKIRKAFSEIENASKGYLEFGETSINPDITILCYQNFSEKYEEFEKEIEVLKTCENISFEGEKKSATNSEQNIGYNEYKISSKIIFQNSEKTVWEVCKVDKTKLTFDPEIIFDSDTKLNEQIFGEGGPSKTIGNIILNGKAKFFGDKNNIVSCTSGFPLTEVHELLHVLGFSHSIEETELPKDNWGYPKNDINYISDVLYPYKVCLNQTNINDRYSSCLQYIYSNGLTGNCSDVRFMFE